MGLSEDDPWIGNNCDGCWQELDLFVERCLPLLGWVENHAHAEEFLHGFLALLFLVLQRTWLGGGEPQLTVPEVRGLLRHLVGLREWAEAEIVGWCHWRMERNRIAQQSHEKRRREALRRQSRKRKRALSY